MKFFIIRVVFSCLHPINSLLYCTSYLAVIFSCEIREQHCRLYVKLCPSLSSSLSLYLDLGRLHFFLLCSRSLTFRSYKYTGAHARKEATPPFVDVVSARYATFVAAPCAKTDNAIPCKMQVNTRSSEIGVITTGSKAPICQHAVSVIDTLRK
jgi:hypothetical protein